MCGGFNCSKNALTALNILFLLVSFVLIITASYAKAAAIVESIEIAGGIIACGLFLFLISILGLVAASKHHQVLLFFYFVILFLLFLIQFSVSIACLAVSNIDQENALRNAWNSSSDNKVVLETIGNAEELFKCCGWNRTDLENEIDHCVKNHACSGPPNTSATPTPTPSTSGLPPCMPCDQIVTEKVSSLLVATGGIGFFFSLMELLGVYLAVRFRNQKDPKANPSQFL